MTFQRAHGVAVRTEYGASGRMRERIEAGDRVAPERVGLMVWSPLAGGLLSGKYDLGETHDTT